MSTFRTKYRQLSEDERFRIEQIKIAAEVLEEHFEKASMDGAKDRHIALAKTKLEEAVMWAVKGVTD